ncbi:MAG: DUF1449 family protein [Bacteroidia bacterium]|nr:DUF1449 family protein [Bacteroidia bacterium]
MWQVILESFTLYNIIPTILLGVVLLYWLVFLIGLADLDFLHIDFDSHAEVDLHADVDAHADVDSDAGHSSGGLHGVLSIFGLGKVPLMIWFSFFALLFWGSSLAINHFTQELGVLIHMLLLIPLFLVIAFVTRFVTAPFAKLFKSLDAVAKPLDLVGKIGMVTIGSSSTRMGQVEVRIDGDVIRVNAKVHGSHQMKRGDEAVIFEYDSTTKLYYITPKNF